MVEATTKGIKISVNVIYQGTQKRFDTTIHVFSYQITISNNSSSKVQLFSRRWNIYDSLNHTEVVEGDGVIGLQPVLEPGEKHTYRSYSTLFSNCGAMSGHYNMLNLDEKTTFRVKIPTFQLNATPLLN